MLGLSLSLRNLLVMLLSYSVHDAGDLKELRLGEFAQNCLQLRTLDQTRQLEVVLGTVLKVAVLVTRVLDQIPGPHALLARSGASAIRQLDAQGHVDGR